MTGLQWLRSRDAGLAALRRAGRAAIVMPAMLALSEKVIDDATDGDVRRVRIAGHAALRRLRRHDARAVQAQIALILTGAAFICIGTLAGQEVWLAAIGMFVAGFAVLFAGVVSSVLAGASTALLLGFILPVTLPGPVSSIPARLSGWLLAGAASLVAIVLLWPAPAQDQYGPRWSGRAPCSGAGCAPGSRTCGQAGTRTGRTPTPRSLTPPRPSRACGCRSSPLPTALPA